MRVGNENRNSQKLLIHIEAQVHFLLSLRPLPHLTPRHLHVLSGPCVLLGEPLADEERVDLVWAVYLGFGLLSLGVERQDGEFHCGCVSVSLLSALNKKKS